MELTEDQLTFQEAATVTGFSAHTRRYYERVGLIHPNACQGNMRHRHVHPGDAAKRGASAAEMLIALRGQVEERILELNENLKLVHYKIEIYGQMIKERVLEKI